MALPSKEPEKVPANTVWSISPDARLQVCHDLDLLTNDYQDRIVLAPERFVIDRAAARTGKSWTAVKRHFPMALAPNTIHWIVGPTYDLAYKEFQYYIELLRRWAIKVGQPWRKVVPKLRDTPTAGDLYIRLYNGSQIFGKSATNPFSLVAEGVDSMILAEAAQLNPGIWPRYLRQRLVTKGGFATFATTPHLGGVWLYDLEMKTKGMADWAHFHQPAWECSHYDKAELERLKLEMGEDSDAYQEQVGGNWRFHGGHVYSVFSMDRHIVEPFPVPPSWRIVSAMDFGTYMANEWMGLSPTGEAYLGVVPEYYWKGDVQGCRSITDHAKVMLAREREYKIHTPVRMADHHGLGGQLICQLSREGFVTSAVNHDKVARRDAALQALTPKPNRHPYHAREAGLPAGDYPDLFLMRGRCLGLEEELLHLTFKDDMGTKTRGHNHAIDTMEYLCHRWLKPRITRSAAVGRGRRAMSYDPTGYYAMA